MLLSWELSDLWGQWALRRVQHLKDDPKMRHLAHSAERAVDSRQYHKAMFDVTTMLCMEVLERGGTGLEAGAVLAHERKRQQRARDVIRALGDTIQEEGLGALGSEEASFDPWITEQIWIYFDMPDLSVVQDWCRWCAEMHLRGEG